MLVVHLENVEAGRGKFWRAVYGPDWAACQWGPRGTDGQVKDVPAELLHERERAKLGRGYRVIAAETTLDPVQRPRTARQFTDTANTAFRAGLSAAMTGPGHLIVLPGWCEERAAKPWLDPLTGLGFHHPGTDRLVAVAPKDTLRWLQRSYRHRISIAADPFVDQLTMPAAEAVAVLWEPSADNELNHLAAVWRTVTALV